MSLKSWENLCKSAAYRDSYPCFWTKNMHAESSAIVPRLSKVWSRHIRSQVSNQPSRMVIDGRTALGRRIRDLAEIFVQRLGGWDVLNDMELTAVKRAAEMVGLAEQARANALQHGKVDLDKLLRFEGSADRAVRRLGIKPESKPAPASLADYLRSKAT